MLTAIAEKALIDVPESLHDSLPKKYFVRARSLYMPESSSSFRFGFSASGKGVLKVDGKVVIDQWTSQLPKTESTPCFNRLSMAKFSNVDVVEQKPFLLEALLVNEDVSGGVGTALTLAGRVGGFEVLDEDQSVLEAAELAKKVDVAILITGLSSDYEYEGSDRKHLGLPGRTDRRLDSGRS